MILFKRLLTVLIFISAVTGSLWSQDIVIPSTAQELKITTAKILGQDDLLVNGIQYIPAYTKVTGSAEFEQSQSTSSVLFIKGRKFQNIRLAYDIVSDKVLLVQDYGQGLEDRIELYLSLVDSFMIGDQLFINPSLWTKGFTGSGYYEKVSSGKIVFLKKYRKTFLSIYDNLNRGKYSPQQFRNYLLDSDGMLIPVYTKSSFLNYFSADKKNVRHFLSENKINLKNADNDEIRQLMYYCNSLADEVR